MVPQIEEMELLRPGVLPLAGPLSIPKAGSVRPTSSAGGLLWGAVSSGLSGADISAGRLDQIPMDSHTTAWVPGTPVLQGDRPLARVPDQPLACGHLLPKMAMAAPHHELCKLDTTQSFPGDLGDEHNGGGGRERGSGMGCHL